MMKVGTGYYYSLTSIIQAGFSKVRVADWIRTKKAIGILGVWESQHNGNFNYGEFAIIREWAHGPKSKNFKLSAKDWIERTNAIGLVATPGRHGSTYAHWDIALEFANWVNPFFKQWLITEMAQREEQKMWFPTT